jgi:hypothetical protein
MEVPEAKQPGDFLRQAALEWEKRLMGLASGQAAE